MRAQLSFRGGHQVARRWAQGVGGLLHSEWRAFQNDRKTVEAHNFVDGDLVEAFLELPADKMQLVADEMAVSVEELSKRVRDLERLH